MKLLPAFLLPFLLTVELKSQTADLAPSPIKSVEIHFDFGKHDLLPEADSTLASLLKYCRPKGSFKVRITAHTDSIGTLSNNEALSQRRAGAVADFLKENGVDPASISMATFGETKPAASNGTDKGRYLNRRATVEVFKSLPVGMVEGTVVDVKTGSPVMAEVVLHTKETRDTLQTDEKGYFKKTYPVGTVVGIDVFARCYFMKSDMVKALKESEPKKLELKPAVSGEIMDIDNLYFEGNQAVLKNFSKPELSKILQFMQTNPVMKIEIAGHVNLPNRPEVTETSWEYKLSVARAKLVHDYLLENGVAQNRISFKGYGNWEMRYPQAVSEEQQAHNRRVEIRIIEGGCP